MARTSRWMLAAVLAALAVAGLGLVLTWETEPLGPVHPAGGSYATLERERLRKQVLEQKMKVLADRVEAKRRLIGEVIEGRRTLFEAAAGLHRLKQAAGHGPLSERFLQRLHHAATPEEALCRQVIDDVGATLGQDTARRDRVVRRLEAELAAHLKRYGRVRLPPSLQPAP